MNTDQLKLSEGLLVGRFGASATSYAYDLTILKQLKEFGLEASEVCDVGGSSGVWSVVCEFVYPGANYQIFDPLIGAPEYEDLRGKLANWSALMASDRCHFHPVALGRANGAIAMTVYPGAVGSTTIALTHEPPNTKPVRVPCFRLDDYYTQNSLALPDIIKLDVQGAELEVLEGATNALEHAAAVVCECWLFAGYGPNTPSWLEIANALAGHDFHMFDFGWIYRRPSDQRAATVDMVFLKRTLPFSPLRSFPMEG